MKHVLHPCLQLKTLLIAILLTLSAPPAISQQDSCEDLDPVAGILGYGSRASGKWCEGLYRSNISGPIELVHLGRNLNKCRSATSAVIRALPSFNDSSSDTTSDSLRLIGSLTEGGIYYRYDRSIPLSGNEFAFDTKLIEAANIPLDRIQFRVLRGSAFTPLEIEYQQDKQPCQEMDPLYVSAAIRLPFRVSQLAFRWSCRRVQPDHTWETVPLGQHPPLLPIEFSVKSPPSNECFLEVRAKTSSESWASGTFAVRGW